MATGKRGYFLRFADNGDIPELYSLLKDKPQYNTFFMNISNWPCLACIKDGKIIAYGFADYIESKNYASLHIVVVDIAPFELVKQSRKALQIFFNALDVRTIRVFINENYRGAQTLAKRLGFRFEGTLYDYRMVKGKWTDFKVFSIKEELL